jgi:hypothetical protein
MVKPTQACPPAKNEEKVPTPTPEFHKPHYVEASCPKIKFISADKLAQVAMVLDFSID